MKKVTHRLVSYGFLAFITLALTLQPVVAQDAEIVDASYTVREGVDFATRVLRDPWDMSEYTDISQWLNQAGTANYLLDINVSNGIFSARTAGDYSDFYPLYPGYEPGFIFGKTGAVHPILTDHYRCFYMAMESTWGNSDPNFFILFWAPGRAMAEWVNDDYTWGIASGNVITKGIRKLYRVDLGNPAFLINKSWSYMEYWQALRVTPSLERDTTFSVDWIRLTDCQPVNVHLTGLSSGTYSVWVGNGISAQVRVVDSFSPQGGAYDWDVQGLAGGNYTYYVKNQSGGVVQQGSLNVVPTPIVDFTRPSQVSGEDYATRYGNAWDFGDPGDVTNVNCASDVMANNLLYLDTAPPSMQPGCVRKGANEMDPNVYLNTPVRIDVRQYRYLSFRHLINGAWSMPPQGMVVRWIWLADRSGPDCYYVSREVALDVVWQDYTIDMFDDWNGMPVESTPSGCGLVHWKNEYGKVKLFRMDPNENITSSTLHQEFDWIRLTKVDSITRGAMFPIKVLLNKPYDQIVSLAFYYTTDLLNPTQHPAAKYTVPPLPSGPYWLFLPIIPFPLRDPFVENLAADFTYPWDTTNVSPGQYYVCAVANDGYNQAHYCSEAPVIVTSP
jgi:hypothetical protein